MGFWRMPDGYVFIDAKKLSSGENDIYVSPAQIRKFNLKTGDLNRNPYQTK